MRGLSATQCKENRIPTREKILGKRGMKDNTHLMLWVRLCTSTSKKAESL